MGYKMNNDADYSNDSYDLSEILKRQVNEQMEEDQTKNMNRKQSNSSKGGKRKKKKKKHTGLKIFATFIMLLAAFSVFLVFTAPGKKLLVKIAAHYISSGVNQLEEESVEAITWNTGKMVGRKEDYVTNILLIGIEEFGGAKNTDSMMIVSMNSRDCKITVSSLMRDSYVSVPGWKKTKLNAAYSHGGIELLKETIEENYMIHLDGYASVNFESFEDIIDSLGGIELQLGASEAEYLRTTNYISKKANRASIHEGMNTMNGNQTLGFCRVRKKPTYDGVNNDFGRTLRQRRVLNAVFEKYKSQNIFKLISVTNKCLNYVTTSVSDAQIEMLLGEMVEKNITNLEMERIPVDGAYESPKVYEGVTWPIVLNWDENIKAIYEKVYGDTEEEASSNLALMKATMN